MTYRPLASKIHADTMRRLSTAMEQAKGDPHIALFTVCYTASMLDHYRDQFPDPAEVMSLDIPDLIRDYLVKVAMWLNDMNTDRSVK